MLDGRLRSLVRQLTNKDVKGILQGLDMYRKIGKSVLEVLAEKLLVTTVPSPEAFSECPNRAEGLDDPTPLEIFEEDISRAGDSRRRLGDRAASLGPYLKTG